eukprot:SAG22_NODE_9755_length_571_cov_1.192797_1_plen_180_part_10
MRSAKFRWVCCLLQQSDDETSQKKRRLRRQHRTHCCRPLTTRELHHTHFVRVSTNCVLSLSHTAGCVLLLVPSACAGLRASALRRCGGRPGLNTARARLDLRLEFQLRRARLVRAAAVGRPIAIEIATAGLQLLGTDWLARGAGPGSAAVCGESDPDGQCIQSSGGACVFACVFVRDKQY